VTVPNSIAGIIRERAARSPDHVAICGEGRTITFGELDERSNRLANALAALGVSKGDRVVYVDRNATEYWEVAFATAKLGAAITPLNFRLSGGEIATIIADAEPSAAVLSAQVARELGQSWAPRGLPLLLVGGEGDLAGAQDYEEVMTAHGAHDPGGAATGTELAVLMYSSGTTGASKGVRVTASNLLAGVDNFTREFTPDASSSSLVPPPYYHIAASGWSLIAMNAGGRIVQVRDPMPERLLELMVAERTTHAALVPVIIRMLVEMPEAQEADFTSLRTAPRPSHLACSPGRSTCSTRSSRSRTALPRRSASGRCCAQTTTGAAIPRGSRARDARRLTSNFGSSSPGPGRR
jgi:long-chain acyl-CoA synthetase